MTNIIKYSLSNPNSSIMIIENGYINNNTISINPNIVDKIFLPTMYQSWTTTQKSHIKFNTSNTDDINVKNDILYIFDTWGISSYYHLLIDHIIPVWITKQYIEKYLLENNVHFENSQYLRISNNNYQDELSTSNDIFKYFLKDNYKDNICGKYKYIIYGYCYTYRPYHGGNILYYENYQNIFNSFIEKYNHINLTQTKKYIIIPDRENRNYNKIEDIYLSLCKNYNVMKVDFSKYQINEQINLCSCAYALIGCEGAAFTNQIFMNKKSLIISICPESEVNRNKFHSSIAKYMNHDFNTITFNDKSNINDIINNINFIIENYLK